MRLHLPTASPFQPSYLPPSPSLLTRINSQLQHHRATNHHAARRHRPQASQKQRQETSVPSPSSPPSKSSSKKSSPVVITEATPSIPSILAGSSTNSSSSTTKKEEGPSADLSIIFSRLSTLTTPYWTQGPQASSARWRLAGVLALTLGTTGVSVVFNFLGRDFFNALSAKDQATFTEMLFKWVAAICAGIPVYVLRDYYQSRLALEWREWMTTQFTEEYFDDQTFYRVQAGALLDNPDQRIAVDVRNFTDTTLSFGVTLLNAAVDLVSFSGILYSIYPPLFAALLIYSIGGTAASLAIGRPLVGLNFAQEAAEANFRYGLVRVRENAESIAFYGGEDNEARLLGRRLRAAVDNFGQLLIASRNLSFFTSFYRFLIQVLPAAVVAPLFFRGEIEFGVVNQSASAFNHILTDVSLVVYQFEALAGFSAVVDRLGELKEVLDGCKVSSNTTTVDSATIEGDNARSGSGSDGIARRSIDDISGKGVTLNMLSSSPSSSLLDLHTLTLTVPTSGATLIKDLNLQIDLGHSLLIMGPSGSGKTSLLRTVAGLWRSGSGEIVMHGEPMGREEGAGEVFFVPQRPYVVLGTLRDQLLYPTWAHPFDDDNDDGHDGSQTGSRGGGENSTNANNHPTPTTAVIDPDLHPQRRPLPSDDTMREVLRTVQLGPLLERIQGNLDAAADWASVLSLGEQQRVAFARVLLAKPRLVLMDESTSALDTRNERMLYQALRHAGVTYVSVGHRPTLLQFHERVLLLKGDGGGGWSVKKAEEVSLETAVEFMD